MASSGWSLIVMVAFVLGVSVANQCIRCYDCADKAPRIVECDAGEIGCQTVTTKKGKEYKSCSNGTSGCVDVEWADEIARSCSCGGDLCNSDKDSDSNSNSRQSVPSPWRIFLPVIYSIASACIMK